MRLLVRAAGFRPLANGNQTRCPPPPLIWNVSYVPTIYLGFESGTCFKSNKMLGPNKICDFVRYESLVVERHLSGKGKSVRVIICQLLEGSLNSRIQHFLPGLEPPSKIKVNRLICKLIKLLFFIPSSPTQPSLKLGSLAWLFIHRISETASKYSVLSGKYD